NPAIAAFYRRLLAAGKPKQLALIACMGKLLTTLNAMARTGARGRPGPAGGRPWLLTQLLTRIDPRYPEVRGFARAALTPPPARPVSHPSFVDDLGRYGSRDRAFLNPGSLRDET